MPWDPFEILDISQPITSKSACFPGDTPFSKQVMVHHAVSQVMNLTQFTMSPHVGTHADAPVHLQGDLATQAGTIGHVGLSPFIGPCFVLDIGSWPHAITLEQVLPLLPMEAPLPERILFKTTETQRHTVFEDQYAYFDVDLIEHLGELGVKLVGLDTPSVDHIASKALPVHHTLLQHDMAWLENLDLTEIETGPYFLIALPLKLMELEASPVRAVLLKPGFDM